LHLHKILKLSSGLVYSAAFIAFHRVAGINNQLTVGKYKVVIITAVVGGNQNTVRIRSCQELVGKTHVI